MNHPHDQRCVLLHSCRLSLYCSLALISRWPLLQVTKSLPCIPLLSYLMERLETRSLMVFSPRMLIELLRAFHEHTDTDYLLGTFKLNSTAAA